MVYGYYITDTVGNKRFFVEGCTYCSMSTGGQHQAECPCKNLKVADTLKDSPIIHINSPRRAKEVMMDREQRADEELKAGKYQEFNSVEALIDDLHRVSVHICPRCGQVFYPESATDIHCVKEERRHDTTFS